MKLGHHIACAFLIGLLAAGVAAAASLDRNGSWTPTVFYPQEFQPGQRDMINDGSFEFGPPPASAWTEVSVPSCEWIGDFSGAWYVSAYEGYLDYWAGGYCVDPGSGNPVPATSSVTQQVTVPAGNTNLTFYYVSFRVDADDEPFDGDRAYVAIDGVEVWSLAFTQANNTYPLWTGPIAVDVSAYAGQDVLLTFGGVSGGDFTGNLRFDYIEFVGLPSPAQTTSWGSVKALFR